MEIKYLKPETHVIPMLLESCLAGSKNQGGGSEDIVPGSGIGGEEEEDGKLNVWEEENSFSFENE